MPHLTLEEALRYQGLEEFDPHWHLVNPTDVAEPAARYEFTADTDIYEYVLATPTRPD